MGPRGVSKGVHRGSLRGGPRWVHEVDLEGVPERVLNVVPEYQMGSKKVFSEGVPEGVPEGVHKRS